jgi:hypothetical protein
VALNQIPGRVLDRKDWSGFEITPAMQDAAYANRESASALWAAARESGYLRECLRLRRARNAPEPGGTSPGAA